MHFKKYDVDQKSGDGVLSLRIPQAKELKPRSESTLGQERFGFVQKPPKHNGGVFFSCHELGTRQTKHF